MRLKVLIACFLVLGLSVSMVSMAGAMGKAPKKAEAQTAPAFTLQSVNQYANLTNSSPQCVNGTSIQATAVDANNAYVFLRVNNGQWSETAQLCYSIMGFGEMRKYDKLTGELVASHLTEPSEYNVSALALTQNGSLWGVQISMGVGQFPAEIVEIDTDSLAKIRTVVVDIPGIPDIKLTDVAADRTGISNLLIVAGSAALEVQPTPRDPPPPYFGFIAALDANGAVLWYRVDSHLPEGRYNTIAVKETLGAAIADDYVGAGTMLSFDPNTGVEGSRTPLPIGFKAHAMAISESTGVPGSGDSVVFVGGEELNPVSGGNVASLVAYSGVNLGNVTKISIGFGDPNAPDARINDLAIGSETPNNIEIVTTGEEASGSTSVTLSLFNYARGIWPSEAELTLVSHDTFPGNGTGSMVGSDIDPADPASNLIYLTGDTNTGLGGPYPYPATTTASFFAILAPNPASLIEALIAKVESMNLHQGIENSLDAKLANAVNSLESVKTGNRQDAVNKIQAFVNECYAQRGVKLTIAQADELIADGETIIAALQ